MTNETKIDPQYGFVNCDASDPARTELWCPLWKMWCKPQDVDLVAAVKDHNCGQNWRKEILLPDGKPNGQSDEWELVGMDESFLGDTNPTVFLEGAWHSDWLQTDQQGEICCKTPREHSKTHPESIIIAFARRKTKPAPVAILHDEAERNLVAGVKQRNAELVKQLADEQAKVKDLSDVLREYLSRCPDCGGSGSFPVQSGGESDAEAYQQQCQWCDSGLITLSQAEAMKGKQE